MNNYTEEEKAKQLEVFKEVAEENLRTFTNGFKSALFEYASLNKHRITEVLTDDETRHLAINFFTTQLAKKSFENQNFYFDKLLTFKQ